MKTKEELNALKEEVDTLNKKLAELSEDELKQITGGVTPGITPSSGYKNDPNDPPKLDNYGPCGGIGRMDNVFEG